MKAPTSLHESPHSLTSEPPPCGRFAAGPSIKGLTCSALHPTQTGAVLELGDLGSVVRTLDRAEGTGRALELDVAAAVAQRAGRDGRSALLPGFYRRALAFPAR